MKIRIHLVDGNSIMFDVPDSFNLENLVFSIRDTGRLVTKAFYVPADKIVSIILLDASDQPIVGTLQ